MKGQCEIHAFEPAPRTFQRLSENINLNGFGSIIHAENAGLANAEGDGYITEDLHHSDEISIDLSGVGIRVPLTTLNAYCDQRLIKRLDFLKIDVEGFEQRVLEGGERAVRRYRPVIFMEFNPRTLAKNGSSVEIVAEMLRKNGYSLHLAKRNRIVPFNRKIKLGEYWNVFCFPTERALPFKPGVPWAK